MWFIWECCNPGCHVSGAHPVIGLSTGSLGLGEVSEYYGSCYRSASPHPKLDISGTATLANSFRNLAIKTRRAR